LNDTLRPSAVARRYDTATALWIGGPFREDQQDALIADFHAGSPCGFAILADGVGGSGSKTAGSVASRIAAIDAMSHFKFLMHDGLALETRIGAELSVALDLANKEVQRRIEASPELAGMATTFLATVLFENRLYWVSVGDSPLFLLRDGKIERLNENHSQAYLVERDLAEGKISEEEAKKDSRRNIIQSALTGKPEQMSLIDLRDTAWVLQPGDTLLVASDGLEYLSEEAIAAEIAGLGPSPSSREICDRLMEALQDLAHPKQDNTALLVLRTLPAAHMGGETAADDIQTLGLAVEEKNADAVAPERSRFDWKKLLFPCAILAALVLIGTIALRVDRPGAQMAQEQTSGMAIPSNIGSKEDGAEDASDGEGEPASGDLQQ